MIPLLERRRELLRCPVCQAEMEDKGLGRWVCPQGCGEFLVSEEDNIEAIWQDEQELKEKLRKSGGFGSRSQRMNYTRLKWPRPK